jgi:hypothetical protein
MYHESSAVPAVVDSGESAQEKIDRLESMLADALRENALLKSKYDLREEESDSDVDDPMAAEDDDA